MVINKTNAIINSEIKIQSEHNYPTTSIWLSREDVITSESCAILGQLDFSAVSHNHGELFLSLILHGNLGTRDNITRGQELIFSIRAVKELTKMRKDYMIQSNTIKNLFPDHHWGKARKVSAISSGIKLLHRKRFYGVQMQFIW